jgi:hypothetical protein
MGFDLQRPLHHRVRGAPGQLDGAQRVERVDDRSAGAGRLEQHDLKPSAPALGGRQLHAYEPDVAQSLNNLSRHLGAREGDLYLSGHDSSLGGQTTTKGSSPSSSLVVENGGADGYVALASGSLGAW